MVHDSINDDLLKLFELEEIKCVVFQMGGLKAAGLDKFHSNFYQSCCGISNSILARAISTFSLHCLLAPKMNHTNTALIPKVATLKSITQFRPISLCNFS